MPDKLEWFECQDFSAGVVRTQQGHPEPLTVTSSLSPPGSARNARGCLASPAGALIPGWHLVNTQTDTALFTEWDEDHRPQDVTGKDFLVGSAIMSPQIGTYGKTTSNRADDPDQLFTLHANWYDTGGGGDYIGHAVWTSIRNDAGGPALTRVQQDNDLINNPGFITGTDARRVRGYMTSGYATAWDPIGGDFNVIPPYDDPNPLWFVVSDAASSELEVLRLIYPEPAYTNYAATASDIAVAGSPGLSGDFATYHAGRLVIGGAGGYSTYGLARLFEGEVTQFDVQYTGVFEMASKAAAPIAVDPVYLQDSALSKAAALCSVNANTLFIQMDTSGGYIIQGDLSQPQVTHLPGIPSAFGMAAIPVATAKGIFITSRTGIYLWNQGPTADLVSAQLPGDFWISRDWEAQRRHGASKGKLGYADPFVTVPNDWVFDTRSGSWWQMYRDTTAAAPFFHYETSSSGKVYALPEYRDEDHTATSVLYDPYTMANDDESWLWESNVVMLGQPRHAVEVREIELVVSGSGSITVSVQSAEHSWAATLNIVTGLSPVRHRLDASVLSKTSEYGEIGAGSFTYSFNATGDDTAFPAPIVHSIRIGWQDGGEMGKAS